MSDEGAPPAPPKSGLERMMETLTPQMIQSLVTRYEEDMKTIKEQNATIGRNLVILSNQLHRIEAVVNQLPTEATKTKDLRP